MKFAKSSALGASVWLCLASTGCFKLIAPEPVGTAASTRNSSESEQALDAFPGDDSGVFFVRAGGWRQIMPEHGKPPYGFELMHGPGILTRSGYFVGDGRDGLAVVRVDDSAGKHVDLQVIVGRFFAGLRAGTDADTASGVSPPLVLDSSTSGTFLSSFGLLARPGFEQTRIAQGAVLESERRNYLVESERFDTATWVPNNRFPGADPVIEEAIAAAPDGRITAARLEEGVGGTAAHAFNHPTVQAPGLLPSGRFVYSCFLKPGEIRNVTLRAGGSDVEPATFARFDVLNGTVLSVGSDVVDVDGDAVGEAGLVAFPGGWRRAWLVGQAIAGAIVPIGIDPSIELLDDDGSGAYAGPGGRGLFAWGCQIEAGEILGSYIPAYNLIAASEDLDTTVSAWAAFGLVGSPALDQTEAPNNQAPNPPGPAGSPQTADKVVETTGNGTGELSQNITVRGGAAYSISCYLKADERSEVKILMSGSFPAFTQGLFNLAVPSSNTGAGASDGAITDVGSGWFRASFAATASVDGLSTFKLIPMSSGTDNYAHTAGSGFFAWGCQVAEIMGMPFPRPYSATLGASSVPITLRTADRLDYSNSGQPHVRGLAGTVILAYTPNRGAKIDNAQSRILFDARLASNIGVEIFIPAGAAVYRTQMTNGGSLMGLNSFTEPMPGRTDVIAVTWDAAGQIILYVNGVGEVFGIDGSAVPSGAGDLRIGTSFDPGHAVATGEISHVMTFYDALPPDEIAKITAIIREALGF